MHGEIRPSLRYSKQAEKPGAAAAARWHSCHYYSKIYLTSAVQSDERVGGVCGGGGEMDDEGVNEVPDHSLSRKSRCTKTILTHL